MAANTTNYNMISLNPAQIAQLPANEQAQYMKGMTPSQQMLVQQEAQNAIISANRNFMRQSIERTAYCPVTGGSGTTANYSAGTTLYFDFPTVAGFAKALIIHYNLTVTPASGSSATYALTQAGKFAMFSELQVLYNAAQVRTHPYFASKFMDQALGYLKGGQNSVLAGNNDSTIAANIVGSSPIVVGSGNSWIGTMCLRLNPLGEDTVPGVLPIAGVGNHPQVALTCAPNFLGMDPLLNAIYPTGAGSGWAVTVTGTVSVEMIYLDGNTFASPAPLSLNWQGEPTIQYTWESPLTPFNANSLQPKTISSKLKHWYAVAIIIDGNQSNQFMALSNLSGFEIDPDQVGNNKFVSWNTGNNVPIYDFYDRQIRRPFGQDFDDGVIPWIVGPCRGIINASNRNGTQFLNMYPGGFPAATHKYQVNSVGSQSVPAGFTGQTTTPRVEMFLVSENSAGLTVQ